MTEAFLISILKEIQIRNLSLALYVQVLAMTYDPVLFQILQIAPQINLVQRRFSKEFFYIEKPANILADFWLAIEKLGELAERLWRCWIKEQLASQLFGWDFLIMKTFGGRAHREFKPSCVLK